MSHVEFIKSATNRSHYPNINLPEIAIFGRSNSGKSSFINAYFNRNKLAYVSNTPGKTQALNFFLAENKYIFVDLPGYGFAKVSKKLKFSWQEMIEEYLTYRPNLRGGILIMDLRRDWSEDEELIRLWSTNNNLPLMILLNKVDKLSKLKAQKRLEYFKKVLPEAEFQLISALKKQGIEEVKGYIFKHWINT